MSDKKSWLVLIVVLLIVVVGGVMFFMYQDGGGTPVVAPAADSEYQAVFLVNNQVYFGKLASESSQFAVLTDIYYLQVNQNIQPKDKNAAPNQDVSLVKLGGELHGPSDEMRINRDHILLVEDLREDSNVVKAIKAYQEKQAAEAAAQ